MTGMKTIVFSRTLRQEHHPEVAIVANDQQQTLAALKAPRKGYLVIRWCIVFRSLAEDGIVNTVEVGIVPVLLGAGVPLSPDAEEPDQTSAYSSQVNQTGIVLLSMRLVIRWRNRRGHDLLDRGSAAVSSPQECASTR